MLGGVLLGMEGARKHKKEGGQPLGAKTSPWLTAHKEIRTLVLQPQRTKFGQQLE